MYPIHLSKKAIKDIPRLKRENPKYTAKLWELILDIFKNPHAGIGQVEPLKGDLQTWWSRRITGKHRLVYKVENDILYIASCFGHCGDR